MCVLGCGGGRAFSARYRSFALSEKWMHQKNKVTINQPINQHSSRRPSSSFIILHNSSSGAVLLQEDVYKPKLLLHPPGKVVEEDGDEPFVGPLPFQLAKMRYICCVLCFISESSSVTFFKRVSKLVLPCRREATS